MTFYVNKKRIKGLSLEEGDRVYLLKWNIKTRRLSKKLDYKRLGLFKILWKLLDISYKLDLSKITKLYLWFYVLLLELADKSIPLLRKIYINNLEEYKVKAILDY